MSGYTIEEQEHLEESMERFNAWLDSINFVDKDGKVISPVLTDDISEDPEDDRSEAE